ncbi:MAG: NAD(P)/FAD-dependent oxidoreductase [Candidatus Hodarchaeales archaeon]|jgi:nitrite reductase (NADH) large subunit
MRFIIIGNGIAGITAARVIKKNSSEYSNIKIFSNESYGYYQRPKLPNFLENPKIIPESLVTYDREWYKNENYELHLEEEILEIDRKNRLVKSNLTSYSYDRLLLAIGADCAIPPIPGIDLKHSYDLRTLVDAIQIRNSLQDKNDIAIIGGGLLGIEVAVACAKRGKSVIIFEFLTRLLPQQLDEEGGTLLSNFLAENGIKVITGIKVEKILGENEVEAIQLKDGRIFHSDLLLSCTGIKPRIELAKNAGLEVNNGIIVNNHLETSDPTIYAAGDVAEYKNHIYGIIPPTVQQATVAAHNMINSKSTEYFGSKISATLKVADLFLTSIGFTESVLKLQSLKYIDHETGQYIRIFHQNNIIRAAIILGTKKGIPVVRNLINQSLTGNIGQLKEFFPNLS